MQADPTPSQNSGIPDSLDSASGPKVPPSPVSDGLEQAASGAPDSGKTHESELIASLTLPKPPAVPLGISDSLGISGGTEKSLGLWFKGLVMDQAGASFDLLELNRNAADGRPEFPALYIGTTEGLYVILRNSSQRVLSFNSIDDLSSGTAVSGYFLRSDIAATADDGLRSLKVGEPLRIPGYGCLPGEIKEIVALCRGMYLDHRNPLPEHGLIDRLIEKQTELGPDDGSGLPTVESYSEIYIGALGDRFVQGPKNGIYNIGSICGRDAWINITVNRGEIDLAELDDLMEATRGFRLHFIQAGKSEIERQTDPLFAAIDKVFQNFPDAGLCGAFIGRNSIQCRDYWKDKDLGDPETKQRFDHLVGDPSNLVDPDEIVLQVTDPQAAVLSEIKAMLPEFKLRFEKGSIAYAL